MIAVFPAPGAPLMMNLLMWFPSSGNCVLSRKYVSLGNAGLNGAMGWGAWGFAQCFDTSPGSREHLRPANWQGYTLETHCSSSLLPRQAAARLSLNCVR